MIRRRNLLFGCIFAPAPLMAASPSSAEERWPPQHPWPELTLQRLGAPYGEEGKTLVVGAGGAFFFARRAALDKYRAGPELGRQMAEAKECVFLPEGHELTALETMYMLAGRVHDRELGDGYVVLLSAPVRRP
ncbi:MAG: hypothetical protein ACHQAY_14455 [Hyphomicrobiales bacterium]